MVDDISKLLREKKMLYIWDVERHLHKGNAYINAVMDYVTGMSFKEWTRQIHLRDAQWLLLHTDLPLKKIAGIVGFSSASALGAFIKSCMKVSPSELRKQAFYS